MSTFSQHILMLIGLDAQIPDVLPQVIVFILVIIWCLGPLNARLQFPVPG